MKKLLVGILFVLSIGQNHAQMIMPEEVAQRLDTLAKSIAGLNENVDFTLVNAPLHDLLRAVAETHNLNVSFNQVPAVSVTNNFTNVKVKDLLTFVSQEYNLKIRFTNNIFSFYPIESVRLPETLVQMNPSSKLLTLDLRQDKLLDIAKVITQVSEVNVIVDQSLHGNVVTGYIQDLPIDQALSTLAQSNNLRLTKKDSTVYLFEPPEIVQVQNNQNSQQSQNNRRNSRRPQTGSGTFDIKKVIAQERNVLDVSADMADVKSLIEKACESLDVDYLFLSDPVGTLTCRLSAVSLLDFLNVALEAASFSFSSSESGIYVFGELDKAGLDESHVYSFKRRSVDGLEEIIPESLRNGVALAQFNDLNAFIVTGSDKKTEKMIAFFEEIDRAVPNVLIEVIVAEIRKGASIQTGINAVLSDSVPNTAGSVFPGIDLTLSSGSLNKFLNNLDSKGVVNLGRVTPNFYVTLQAMEENNDLNIRSTPKLSTINGHEANLTIGQSVYYLIETQNVTGGVNPIVTVTPRYEKVEANLELIISPFVSDYQDITLDIEAEFSDFIAPEIQGAPPGNSTRKFISKIRVKNEETIVIGGLEESSRIESGSGVPLLSRIPILKWLFSSKTKQKSDSKLLIFIKPTVVY